MNVSAPEPKQGQRAGAVSRFVAFFVDAVIVTVGLRTTGWLLRGMARAAGHFAPPVKLDELLVALMPLLVGIYLVGFWTALGQTPGKWLMGLKIVPVAGGLLGFKRAVLRLVGYLVSALPLYLGFFWMLGPERRGWHDRLAGTEVTYVRRQRLPAATTLTAEELRARLGTVRRASKAGSRP